MWPVGTLNWCQNCVAATIGGTRSSPCSPRGLAGTKIMGPSTSDIITSFENDQKNMVFSALRYSMSDPSAMSRLKAEEKLLWSEVGIQGWSYQWVKIAYLTFFYQLYILEKSHWGVLMMSRLSCVWIVDPLWYIPFGHSQRPSCRGRGEKRHVNNSARLSRE